MTLRTYVTKSGTTFEWEETEEVIQAVKELHSHKNKTVIQNEKTETF
jgi:hypothetical protein